LDIGREHERTSNLITLVVLAGSGAIGLAILKAKAAAKGGPENKFKPNLCSRPMSSNF
jgi:hypothetical protein